MTPADLHAAVLTRLQGLATVTVHDSAVPDHPAADSGGHVYPYAVLWPVPGSVPGEARNLEHDTAGGLMWDARVTVAAGQVAWALQAISLVRARLEGFRVTAGSALYELEAGGVALLEDEDTSPVRWYAPLTFRVLT